MRKNNNSRREFLKQSSLTGLGAALGMGLITPALAQPKAPFIGKYPDRSKILSIKPRYHRWYVDPGVEWLEKNTGYATLDWKIPLAQTALVLVDVWQRHYIKEPEDRAEVIINNKFIPLLAASRKAGLTIIHAPAPDTAKKHPNWVNLTGTGEMTSKRDNWPPAEFLNQSGPYQSYRRPKELREPERQALPALTFHPKVVPIGQEPVVANGEELHRYCKNNGILFLIYAGFNTNACILDRDYGTLQMSYRGYQVVLLRDCTTGMESKDSQPTLAQTNGAILLLEMFGQYSLTSDELISGLPGLT